MLIIYISLLFIIKCLSYKRQHSWICLESKNRIKTETYFVQSKIASSQKALKNLNLRRETITDIQVYSEAFISENTLYETIPLRYSWKQHWKEFESTRESSFTHSISSLVVTGTMDRVTSKSSLVDRARIILLSNERMNEVETKATETFLVHIHTRARESSLDF